MTEALFGREAELGAVEEFVASIPDGLVCLALEGEAGIGKTTVWHEAVNWARERGLCILSSRAAASEATLSFAGLGDLLAQVPGEVFAALPEPQRMALDVALLRAPPGERALDQHTVAVALLSTIRTLASSSSVLVAIDDAQWLDGATAAVLEFAVRRLDEAAVGILATIRVTPARGRSFDRVIGEGRRRVVRIGPLSAGALHHVITAQLGYAFPRPTLIRIEEASRGNPLYALEFARELLAKGALGPGERLPVSDDLRKLVAARIRRLPANAREALLVASALSSPRIDLVGETPLAAAEEAGIVTIAADGRIGFAHPLFASAVYSAAPASVRREVHRRLAEAVDDLEERVRHLALAAAEPDAGVALALEEAGALARSRGATAGAAELLERASALTPRELAGDCMRRRVRAAEYHFHAGDLARMRSLLEEVLDAAAVGQLRAEALYLLGQASYHENSFPEAIALFEQALEHAADDPLLTVAIEQALSFAVPQAGDFSGGCHHAYAALDLAERLGDRALIAEALAHVAINEFFVGDGVDEAKLDLALASEDVDRPVASTHRPSLIGGVLMIGAGRFEDARRLHGQLYTRLSERGEESSLPFLAGFLAWAECSRGDLAAAARFADEGLDASLHLGSESMQAWTRTFRGLTAAVRGDVCAARSDLDASLGLLSRTNWRWAVTYSLAALGFLELSLGEHAAAAEALDDLTTRVEAQGLIDPFAFSPFLPDEIEALIALGQLERAEPLIGLLERRGRELDRAWALATAGRCRGLLLSARRDQPGALDAVERALAQHDRLAMPLELARTLLVRGEIARRGRRKRAARESLMRALAIFERLGAMLWAERARTDLARLGLRAAPGELTESERRVAELAASGLTNRDVAAQLFISPKTVEANLSRAYRKLGIHSRAELGARLGAERQSA